MSNECLLHSVAIHDPDDNLVEVLYVSNRIFSIECAKKGYKYKMNCGTTLDTSLYDFEYYPESDQKGNIHYKATAKQSTNASPPSSMCPNKFIENITCEELPNNINCEAYYYHDNSSNSFKVCKINQNPSKSDKTYCITDESCILKCPT